MIRAIVAWRSLGTITAASPTPRPLISSGWIAYSRPRVRLPRPVDDELGHRFVWLLKGALSGQMRPALRSSKDLTWVTATWRSVPSRPGLARANEFIGHSCSSWTRHRLSD